MENVLLGVGAMGLIIIVGLVISIIYSKNKVQGQASVWAFASLAVVFVLFCLIVVFGSQRWALPVFVIACTVVPIGVYVVIVSRMQKAPEVLRGKSMVGAAATKQFGQDVKPQQPAVARPEANNVLNGQSSDTAVRVKPVPVGRVSKGFTIPKKSAQQAKGPALREEDAFPDTGFDSAGQGFEPKSNVAEEALQDSGWEKPAEAAPTEAALAGKEAWPEDSEASVAEVLDAEVEAVGGTIERKAAPEPPSETEPEQEKAIAYKPEEVHDLEPAEAHAADRGVEVRIESEVGYAPEPEPDPEGEPAEEPETASAFDPVSASQPETDSEYETSSEPVGVSASKTFEEPEDGSSIGSEEKAEPEPVQVQQAAPESPVEITYESCLDKAEVFKARGLEGIAARLYRQASELAPGEKASQDALMLAMASYVNADLPGDAYVVAQILNERPDTLNPVQRMKIDAVMRLV